jgi:hypothetical protein
LFIVECIEGEIVIDIKIVILTTFITYDGLIEKQIFEHVVCLGVDGVSMFQGVKLKILPFFEDATSTLLDGHLLCGTSNELEDFLKITFLHGEIFEFP